MCCASCSAVVLDSTTHACMVLADAFPRPPLLERSDCHVKVVGTLKENVCGQGKGFTIDNVCSNVFCKVDEASTFNWICKKSNVAQRLPCLLLFAQDICLFCRVVGCLVLCL